jgi:hypothetical protein
MEADLHLPCQHIGADTGAEQIANDPHCVFAPQTNVRLPE